MASSAFVAQHGGALLKLFTQMQPLLSPGADRAVGQMLGV